ncbi:hypothetical protein DFJ74DRAFT_764473 [Hyaloraphidium curvatum]|nr:hypothetical protein DFJ74DRAFT_764473 [Hyaloraphidium curvatum]
MDALLDLLPEPPYQLIAAVAGATAVLAGTIGEHRMRPQLLTEGEEGLKRIKDWEVARLYHLVHAAALAALAAKSKSGAGGERATGWLWALGTAGFAGSIYAIVANRKQAWTKGPAKYATPLGGITMMLGWATVALW